MILAQWDQKENQPRYVWLVKSAEADDNHIESLWVEWRQCNVIAGWASSLFKGNLMVSLHSDVISSATTKVGKVLTKRASWLRSNWVERLLLFASNG